VGQDPREVDRDRYGADPDGGAGAGIRHRRRSPCRRATSGGGAATDEARPAAAAGDRGRTIAPGMAEREIYQLWGAPAAVRRAGEYTYLFFNNGCEYTCGTMDVVTLKDGAVVDAIVRWDGHRYSGESTSPPGKVPIPNTGGDTLRVPPP